MKKFLLSASFIMFLNEGHICWSEAKHQTDHLITHAEVKCLLIPVDEGAYNCVEDFFINYLEVENENQDK